MPLILGVQLFTVAPPSELDFIVQDVKWFDWAFSSSSFLKKKTYLCVCVALLMFLWMYLFTFVAEVLT